MSRQAHLPPRCPLQKKTIVSPTLHKDNRFRPQHHKSASQSLIIDEQPAWLEELLCESESNGCGVLHRRSASDSLTLLPNLSKLDEAEESGAGCGESDDGSKSDCLYGPNSPRGKSKVTFPDNAIVSALSEYVSQNAMQCSDWSLSFPETGQQDPAGDSSGENNMEAKPVKRHPGQRSRVRKLQYIAELERTVDTLQTLRSDLAAKVASLLQQHIALSLENSELKQKLIQFQQEKLLVDAQYCSLRKELERQVTAPKLEDKFRARGAETSWQMLDFGKLGLN
ncbi:PREDICTED: basic leucine zipper 6 [Ipomoea nil]|uniref:basic leucine zipper 6 n=1 Tax=Ipomoea nil TaxID=35883 RepID=UPI0009009E4D|nr:PREDICTED: basic leucine zipper 6 [Ipomoea nil]